MTDLERLWLYESTRIMDDDLSPIAQLEKLTDLRIKSRATYRPTVSELRTLIEARVANLS